MKKELRQAVASRLKKVREILGFTQERMVTFFGVQRTTYTRNERGDTFPGYPVLLKLATKFDISLDWLVCGKGPMIFKEKAATGGSGGTADVKEMHPEHRELILAMTKVPLLHHEVLALFQRFKVENRALMEPVEKSGEQQG